eukprot:scaffold217666_cov18-Tisochrysis_lutea.AAC.2
MRSQMRCKLAASNDSRNQTQGWQHLIPRVQMLQPDVPNTMQAVMPHKNKLAQDSRPEGPLRWDICGAQGVGLHPATLTPSSLLPPRGVEVKRTTTTCVHQQCTPESARQQHVPRRSARSRGPAGHRPGRTGRSGRWCQPRPCQRSWSRRQRGRSRA